MKKELKGLENYILSQNSEDSKRKDVYPFFTKTFGKDFQTESAAEGADGYVAGQLLVELKSKYDDWLKGLYQGLHYRKLGLTFPHIAVISHKFIGIWNINNLPQDCLKLADEADSQISPSGIGQINANKTGKALKAKIFQSNSFNLIKEDIGGLFLSIDGELRGFSHFVKNLDKARIQINLRNFIDHIQRMERFFETPQDAINAFYTIVGYWGDTSKISQIGQRNEVVLNDPSRDVSSEPLAIDSQNQAGFKKFVESHYIFTNEGSGITYDYYFSRFDEVISRLNPDYAKQHGIFFTDHNLSKFAMWFVSERFEKNLSEKYIICDPAGGSGNLITSLDWRGHMKHKIVSELQPDLLKVIERRMRVHEKHSGLYTIVPKTVNNEGLNFLDKSGADYVDELEKVLNEKGLQMDKPLAFLMNPPYKNTDENVAAREQVEAEYLIDPSILELTGADAGRERYLAFLGQIVNIAKTQFEEKNLQPILMIFTPTSWLIPRPTYVDFRAEFDKHFQYENGFIITSNEFFALKGKWPLAFTIWTYNFQEKGNPNKMKLWDFTDLKSDHLAQVNWSARISEINRMLRDLTNGMRTVRFDSSKKDIRTTLPKIKKLNSKKWIQQPRYNSYRNRTKEEEGQIIISGFPLRDNRHERLSVPYGFTDGEFVGFMDDNTPVRLSQNSYGRMSNEPDRIWFRLDNDFKGINKAKIFNGAADNRSYCAYHLSSAKSTLGWFAIAKCLNGKYPLWANQFDIWKPRISKKHEDYFYALCFAFGLAENRCVVTKFEKDNPVERAPEIFVDNPMSTNNPESFWNTVLDNQIKEKPDAAAKLVNVVKDLYLYWAQHYCQNGILKKVGLQDEPYFKYFDYDDFLTPNSGLIQIKKFADLHGKSDLIQHFEIVSARTKEAREEIYRLLVGEFNYFG